MIEICSPGRVEAIGLAQLSSCSRVDVSFPAEHWKLSFDRSARLDRDEIAATFNTLLKSGYRPVTARQFSDSAFLVFAQCADSGFRTIAVPVPFTPATDALLRSPRGLLLAVFGPDGVGKSSVLSAVVNAIAPLFDHQRTMRWRPELVASRIAKEPHKFRLPHSADTHRLPLSMAKLAGAFADFYLDHITLTRNQLRGCSLIAWDRYFHDVLVDKRRYRYDGPSWYPQLLLRHFPVPDRFLGIVLDADECVIQNRKHELSLKEIRRQRHQYRQLTARLAGSSIVRNEATVQDSIKEVLRLVVNTMADWLDPMLPSVLNIRKSDIYADPA